MDLKNPLLGLDFRNYLKDLKLSSDKSFRSISLLQNTHKVLEFVSTDKKFGQEFGMSQELPDLIFLPRIITKLMRTLFQDKLNLVLNWLQPGYIRNNPNS